jgi:hypothetical protein
MAHSVYRLGYELDDRGVGVLFSVRTRDFVFSITSRLALGPTQTPIQWVPGAVSPEVKRLVHEADHSLLSSAEAKNGGTIPPHMSSWLCA